MKIKEKDKNQRPREKAIRYGMETLTDQELLCLLIGSGTKKQDAWKIAEKVLEKSKDLSQLATLDMADLMAIEGIGQARALLIQAALALAMRALKAKTLVKTSIRCQEDVIQWFRAEYGRESQERFAALFLNSKGEVIRHKVIHIGTTNCALIHPRDVFREACLANAVSIVFVHNHPSNDPTPSQDDIQSTHQFIEIAKLFQMNVTDHIIVCKDSSFSFAANAMLM